METRLEQDSKAQAPMLVIEEGMFTEESLGHHPKMPLSNEVIDEGMVADSRFSHL